MKTKQEAAQALGLTERTIDQYVARGLLVQVKTTCITDESIQSYQASRKPKGRPQNKKREGTRNDQNA